MSQEISKKYVKALLSSVEESSFESINDIFLSLTSAFSSLKFSNILFSPEVSGEQKRDFVLSLIENPSKEVTNFIKLLAENGRLGEIPGISKELQKQLAIKNNSYQGVVLSNFEVDSSKLEEIASNLSKKLGSTITLENRVTDYPGLKVEIDDLGIEVGLSSERVKSQIAEHILKSL
jgi:F-type H+-transporting ATPase subunit delta